MGPQAAPSEGGSAAARGPSRDPDRLPVPVPSPASAYCTFPQSQLFVLDPDNEMHKNLAAEIRQAAGDPPGSTTGWAEPAPQQPLLAVLPSKPGAGLRQSAKLLTSEEENDLLGADFGGENSKHLRITFPGAGC